MTDAQKDSISRFHVRINGKRTTVSLDPDLFLALTIKLGGAAYAREWVNINAADMVKVNKSISRQLQAKISLILVDKLPLPAINLPDEPAKSEKPAKPKTQTFQSDDLPL